MQSFLELRSFHQYLYGNTFMFFTDHYPFVQIFSSSKALPAYTALRMQHYAVLLQGHTFDIKHKNMKQLVMRTVYHAYPLQ